MRNVIFGLSAIICNLTMSCHSAQHHHGHANHHMHQRSFEEIVATFDSPEREVWQKPKQLIAFIEAEIRTRSGKKLSQATLADLGAGSGYFALRFHAAGARVLALDTDERFVALLKERAAKLKNPDRLIVRKISESDAGLKAGEADALYSVNVYHHIENREAYFRALKERAPTMVLYIIDFKDGKQPYGPPPEIKVSLADMQRELISAGYGIAVDNTVLPYQNILIATPAGK